LSFKFIFFFFCFLFGSGGGNQELTKEETISKETSNLVRNASNASRRSREMDNLLTEENTIQKGNLKSQQF
jgi:hypothetical protein